MSKYEQTSFDSNNSPERKKQKLKIVDPVKFGRATILALTLAVGIGMGANSLTEKATGLNIPDFLDDAMKNEVTYSNETNSYLIKSGDTIWGLTRDHLGNVDSVDIRDAIHHIEEMPENADTFEDDTLQTGEVLTIPNGVKKK